VIVFDPAFYRHMRLTPVHFDYCRKDDIINMIEKFYNKKLNDRQKTLVPDRNSKISGAHMRYLLEKFEYNFFGILNELKKISN
jgi:hypothetical protein